MKCEKCTLCCKLLPIEQLEKHASVLCKFCNDDGCIVYSTRPEACKNFKCYYLSNENLSPELRPDKCHMIFEKIDNYNIYLALEDPEYIGVHKDYMYFIEELNKQNYSVIVSSYSRAPKHLYITSGVTKEEVMKQIKESVEAL